MMTTQVQIMFNNGYQVWPYDITVDKEHFKHSFASFITSWWTFDLWNTLLTDSKGIYCIYFVDVDKEAEQSALEEYQQTILDKSNEDIIDKYVSPVNETTVESVSEVQPETKQTVAEPTPKTTELPTENEVTSTEWLPDLTVETPYEEVKAINADTWILTSSQQ